MNNVSVDKGLDGYDGDYDIENEGAYEYVPEDEYGDESDISYNALAILGTYDGQRNSNNERHGFGKAILPNGDAYVGTYKNGLRHGYGQYKFKNGAIYQGCYKDGLRNGKGSMIYQNKSKYEGFWIDNKKDGDGVFTYENHDEFSGSWKSNAKHGLGTYTFCKTGAVLKGTWKNDKKVNNFQIFFPTNSEGFGFTFHGKWDNDESVAGQGYYVFENLLCMQRGDHVENPLDKGVRNNSNTMWFSNEILPIINNMLPSLPRKRPMIKKISSCDIHFPSAIQVPTNHSSVSNHTETYDFKEYMWAEADVLENGVDSNALETEQDGEKSSIHHEQDEDLVQVYEYP